MRKGIAIFLCLILVTTMIVIPAPSKALRYKVDSKLSNADASFWGEHANDVLQTGKVIGDVNGDGYTDILMGALKNNDGGTSAGQSYLILGKASGWARDTSASTANASFWGEKADDRSGESVAAAGDVNGDGYDDLMIGALGNDDGGNNAGQTYLFFGKASGWAMDTKLSKADASFIGESPGDIVGYSEACAGDVNGDGYDDILIAGYANGEGGANAGQAYLIFGKASGWAMDTNLSKANASFWGEQADDYAGFSVAGGGDVNGDGYDDFLIGAFENDDGGSNAGQVYLILGKATGWAMDTKLSKADASFWGENAGDWLGWSMADTGDVNRDGYDDILIGAYYSSDGGSFAGQSYLILGKAAGWAMDSKLSNADASFWAEHDYDGSTMVSGAGDVNGDGYDDFLIGAFANDDGGNNAGQSYLILGKASGWAMDTSLSMADASFWGEGPTDYSGNSVSGGADVNGDGYDDILIGSSSDEGGVDAGQMYLIFPDSNSRPTKIDSVKAYPNNTFSKETSNATIDDTVFIELRGLDGNSSRKDIAVVNVTSSASSPRGFPLRLMETGPSTGIYRGNFTIKNRTDDARRWIDASYGEMITISSVQDPSKKATVIVPYPTITLVPLKDSLFAKEDVAYKEHYWAIGPPGLSWTFGTNASWLKWDNIDHNLTGTPDNGDVGKYWVRINVSFGKNSSDEHDFTLTVNNTPPGIKTNDVFFAVEDQTYSVDYNSTDDGQGNITWHLKTNASDQFSLDPITGVLSGIPLNNDVGQHYFNVSVDDGNGGRDFTNFTLTVANVNDPPKIIGKDVTWVFEDTGYASNYSVADPDKYDKSFTWGLKTNASWLRIDTSTGKITGLPGNPDVGSYWVNVTVKDTLYAEGSRYFILTVINVNDPPVWKDVPKNITIKDTDTYSFDVNATDIDIGDVLGYSITSAPASTISIASATGVITWKPSATGTYLINIGVTDSNATLHHEFQITVVPEKKNDPPESILALPTTGADIYVLNPTFKWTVSDKDGDNVTSDLYIGLDFSSVNRLDISAKTASELTTPYFTPDYMLVNGATYYWTVIPHDGRSYGKCTSGVWSFSVSVTAKMNHLPKFVTKPSLDAGVNASWAYTPLATDEDANDTVTYALFAKPDGMHLSAGVIKWTPNIYQLGTHHVTLEATDGKGSTFQVFSMVVTMNGPTNHAPQISPLDPITVKAGQKVSIQIIATDPENDTLIFGFVGAPPPGLQIDNNGLLTWETTKDDGGTHDLVIMVSDGKLSSTRSVRITVQKVEKKDNNASLAPILIAAIIAVIAGAIVAVIILSKRKGRGKEPTKDAPAESHETLPRPPPTPPPTSNG
jgi:hypothetical protein